MSFPTNQSVKAKKEFTSPIKEFLKVKRDKYEIARFLNVDERTARYEVEKLANFYAVISGSFQKGYRLAKPIDSMTAEEKQVELELINRSIAEFNSRIKKLKRRMKPLIAYKKMLMKLNNQGRSE